MDDDHHPRPQIDDERPSKRHRPTSPENKPPSHKSPSDPSATKDTRQKPGKKPPLSCAECRRLKLKCDRVFPCSSCCKRGCSEICPNGALQSGRGSRFILANTEQLHSKIIQLSDRVKQLEDALESLHNQHYPTSHPLLSEELLRIRTSILPTEGSTNAVDQQNGSSSRSNAGSDSSPKNHYPPPLPPPPPRSNEAMDHAQTVQAAAEGLRRLREPEPAKWHVPADLLALSASFPLPWKTNVEIRQRIRNALPSQPEAVYICNQARENALWQYNLDSSDTFISNMLHHVYTVPINSLNPRRLALCLMMLSVGCAVDLNQPLGSPRAESYYHLARACLCEVPLVEEPSFDLLRALFFMIWYMLTFSPNKNDVGYAWSLMGLLTKFTLSMGFHRETSRIKIIPEDLEQRRAFFWELMNLDCRLSLSLGRPPSFCLKHTDSKQPSYSAGGVYVSKEEATYHEWKHNFYLDCLNPILQSCVSPSPVKYEDILKLDSKVRSFPLLVEDGKQSRYAHMQYALVCTSREIALLQLHRSSFNRALSDNPETYNMDHELAPSILATFTSACALITATETLYHQEPKLSARFLGFWFNVFSAGIALSLLVSRAPSCHFTPRALLALDRLCKLWKEAGMELPCTCRALASLEKAGYKSRKIYMQWRAESVATRSPIPYPRSTAPDIFHSCHPEMMEQYNDTKDYIHPPESEVPTFSENYKCAHASHPAEPIKLPSVSKFINGVKPEASDDDPLLDLRDSSSVPLLCSRVSETFNFDFGDLTDQSYMAWF